MLIKQIRAVVLGCLAVLSAASLTATAAYGEAGPFWHHRANSKEGLGSKIEEKAPETVTGTGGEKILFGSIAETTVTITSKSLQVKSILYNNALQGQLKLTVKLNEVRLVKPELKGCEVKVGENNEYKAEGHLMWKWNGEKGQLSELPVKEQTHDMVLTSTPIEAGATELPKASLTTISLKGSGCGVLVGTFKVGGSIAAVTTPAGLEEWSPQLTVKTPGPTKQHFWNGKETIGAEPRLEFDNVLAHVEGTAEGKTTSGQEIAVFEK